MTLLSLSTRALEASCAAVALVTPADLSRPTPCGDWTLSQLIGHMVAHNRGWTLAASGQPADGSVWDDLSLPSSDFAASCSAVTAAFAACSLERLDVYGYGQLSLSTALRMHVVDYVIHGWDVAASLGMPFSVDEDLAVSAFDIMKTFPDRPRPTPAFGVKVPVPATASSLDQFLGYVGRDPAWRAT